MQIEVMLLYDS